MKRLLWLLLSCTVAVVLAAAAWEVVQSQRPDYGWTPHVASRTFTRRAPRVVIDEAHHNASTASVTGRYWPLRRLLEADGCRVDRGTSPFTRAALRGVDLLIVANASGAAKPQIFSINLPGGGKGRRDADAFTAPEIAALAAWIDSGGALLLVADHAPFGAAASSLARALGVRMRGGFMEVPGEISDPLLFDDARQRLGVHPIVSGRTPWETVRRVQTFTGQSLDGPPHAATLLRVPPAAVEWLPSGDTLAAQPALATQGVAFARGRGRVVVLGEAAMLTAQVYKRQRFGMNAPGNDNQQFALNVVHWLCRAL